MSTEIEFVNIAAYKFVTLDKLSERREVLREKSRELDVRGTILLSHEGVNLFVAGKRENVNALISFLRSQPELADLDTKESLSDHQPFNRMLVKIKKEIITFSVDGINPAIRTSDKLKPADLKKWLDEGRDVTLLDVRNDYEVELGTFRDAVAIGTDNFRQFPRAVEGLPNELKDKPIVMFCTGGIRCEKAGPLMEREGFQNVFQLDGGILKYFEECGGSHYDGECFVFDQRVAVDSDLAETETTQCFACQSPLSAEDQASPKYVIGKSCPYCFEPEDIAMARLIEQRHAAIAEATNPLPGSAPYDNVRPMNVPARCDHMTVLDFLDAFHPHVGRAIWQERCEAGRITRDDVALEVEETVRAGERIEHLIPETVEPDVSAEIRILHEDQKIIVVEKPAPLPMHPCGRFNRNTLAHILNQVYQPICPRMVHRLDANTTGIVVLAKTGKVAAEIQPQFQQGEVGKTYLALVHGNPEWETHTCEERIGNRATTAGARHLDEDGLPARTEFRVLQRSANSVSPTTLLEARPVTGRTNQIRIHLSHLGHSIVGDATYVDGHVADQQTLDLEANPLCLHAWAIEIVHPETGERLRFQASRPSWAEKGTAIKSQSS